MDCAPGCNTLDTFSIVRSLKSSSQSLGALFSKYLKIIEDIEKAIQQGLENNLFEDPSLVACITANFIQEIADDVRTGQASRFLDRLAEFQSDHSLSEEQIENAGLSLWELYDFLVNYMSDIEDLARANAIAKCGQCHLTQNDKNQTISSLVSGIYPHCKTMALPRNIIGRTANRVIERALKFGIKYLCTRHFNLSISIAETLPNCDPR
jgi:hypothetical protein